MAPVMTFFDGLERRTAISPSTRRLAALCLLLLMGWLDYVTGPEIASAPFYVVVLVGLAFFEPWWVCLAYSALAALIFLGVDLLTTRGSAVLIYPYWRGFARMFSFALISTLTSQLINDKKQLRRSEQALREKTQELEEKNRKLEEAMRELKRLQGDLVAKERRAAASEAIYQASHAMERPLVSISVYVEELLRLLRRAEAGEEGQLLLDEVLPLLEKVGERVRDLEGILKNIGDLRKREAA